jgi:hypothetical protein
MAQIKNFPHYEITQEGQVISYRRFAKGQILKPQKAAQSKKKYLQVRLFNSEYPNGQLHYIHRLMWEAFIGEIPEGMTIDHKDENTHNNVLDNFVLETRRDNTRKYMLGNYGFILRDYRDEIIKDYITLGTAELVAQKWNVGTTAVYRVLKNKSNVTKNGKCVAKNYDKEFKDVFTENSLHIAKKLYIEQCKKDLVVE